MHIVHAYATQSSVFIVLEVCRLKLSAFVETVIMSDETVYHINFEEFGAMKTVYKINIEFVQN